MRKIAFVSSNKNKYREIADALIDIAHVTLIDLKLIEIQAVPEEIAIYKCQYAATRVSMPFIIEDTCLCFNALNGLPGPYIKQFLAALGNQGLLKILAAFPDKTATATSILAYHDHIMPTKLFTGNLIGNIVEPRGSDGFGWDSIFEIPSLGKTLGELSLSEKNKFSHRANALFLLKNFLSPCNT